MYYSKSVNSDANDYDCRHNCGCCPDSPLEVWPYIETQDGRVYSDPPRFQVGERSYAGGDTPYSGWQQTLRDAGIAEKLIERVGYHFLAEEDSEEPETPEDEKD